MKRSHLNTHRNPLSSRRADLFYAASRLARLICFALQKFGGFRDSLPPLPNNDGGDTYANLCANSNPFSLACVSLSSSHSLTLYIFRSSRTLLAELL